MRYGIRFRHVIRSRTMPSVEMIQMLFANYALGVGGTSIQRRD